jgi:DNA primase
MSDRIIKLLSAAGADKIRETKGGAEIVCTCPFHQDSKPSFAFNVKKQLYTCYSPNCGAAGTLTKFLILALRYSPAEAKKIAENLEEFDVEELDVDNFDVAEYDDRKNNTWEPTELVSEVTLGLFDFCPRYMLKRGFTKKTLRTWEVGWDGDNRRATFPVRDVKGRLLGISKRAVDADVEPRYLHLGFDKRNVLYGANLLGPHINTVIAVEGQTDAIALTQAAQQALTRLATGVVGVLGANVPDEQVKLLSRYDTVILGFDNDDAGRAATLKVGNRLIHKLRPGHLLVADRFGSAKDPGDFIRDRDSAETFVTQTQEYLEYLTRRQHNEHESDQKDGGEAQEREQRWTIRPKAQVKGWRVRTR